MFKKLLTASMATTTIMASVAMAASEQRQLDSHEHGVTLLNMAIENNVIVMELEGPAMNFVGFEYEAQTDEQKAAVMKTLDTLSDADLLFQFNSEADCVLVNARSARLSEADDEDGHEDDHEAHEDEHDGHDDDHDSHDEHKDEVAEASHSEFRADYEYKCAKTDRLRELRVTLFEYFPLTIEIEASAIGPALQTFKELASNDRVLNLKP